MMGDMNAALYIFKSHLITFYLFQISPRRHYYYQ